MNELIKDERPELMEQKRSPVRKDDSADPNDAEEVFAGDVGSDLSGSTAVDQKQKKKKTGWAVVLDYALTILITVGICLLIIKFVAVRSVVDGSSMFPTLSNGDNLIVQKISYYFHDPERFDVIVFQLEDDPDTEEDESKTNYIKRVIGLPGETIEIKSDGFVYVNGSKLEEDSYGTEIMNRSGIAKDPITLKDGEFFVLGDNRNHSRDSRAIGPVRKGQILGKAFVRIWPLNQISIVGK